MYEQMNDMSDLDLTPDETPKRDHKARPTRFQAGKKFLNLVKKIKKNELKIANGLPDFFRVILTEI